MNLINGIWKETSWTLILWSCLIREDIDMEIYIFYYYCKHITSSINDSNIDHDM